MKKGVSGRRTSEMSNHCSVEEKTVRASYERSSLIEEGRLRNLTTGGTGAKAENQHPDTKKHP